MAKHNLVIAMGLGKSKGEMDSAPPSYKSKPKPDTAMEADPNESAADPMEGMETEGGAEGGITPDEVDYSDNDLCETCSSMGHDGMCTKYGFPVDKTGHCSAGYTPMGGDQGAMPGMSDMSGGMDDTQIPPSIR